MRLRGLVRLVAGVTVVILLAILVPKLLYHNALVRRYEPLVKSGRPVTGRLVELKSLRGVMPRWQATIAYESPSGARLRLHETWNDSYGYRADAPVTLYYLEGFTPVEIVSIERLREILGRCCTPEDPLKREEHG